MNKYQLTYWDYNNKKRFIIFIWADTEEEAYDYFLNKYNPKNHLCLELFEIGYILNNEYYAITINTK